MRKFISLTFLLAGLGLFAQETVDEVIKRHIEAHGGLVAWQAVTNMKLSGSFSGSSDTKPFTMVRTGDGKLFFDHYQAENKVLLGSSGGKSWWFDSSKSKHPVDAPAWVVPLIRQWRDLATPLFDYKARGYSVQYLGVTKLAGRSLLGVKLTREEGAVETWYLDPQTYLAVARVSPGSGFESPMEQVTWFEDYRAVGGLKVPFVVEETIGTRHRVLAVENIELNVALDETIFQQPFPSAMDKLKLLVGEWDVEVARRDSPSNDWITSETTSVIEPMLEGRMIMERFALETDSKEQLVRTWTHDQYRENYTIVETSGANGLANVLQGSWHDNVLQVDNKDTQTTVEEDSHTFHQRIRVLEVSEDSFTLEGDLSIDGGERWYNLRRFTYRRKAKK